jgi:hypothetical protein
VGGDGGLADAEPARDLAGTQARVLTQVRGDLLLEDPTPGSWTGRRWLPKQRGSSTKQPVTLVDERHTDGELLLDLDQPLIDSRNCP